MEFAAVDKEFAARLVSAGVNISTVYDIGASNGWWSRTLNSALPDASFELFEPLNPQGSGYGQSMSSTLRDHPNFRLHAIALGAQNASAPMYVYKNAVGSSLLGAMHEGVQEIQNVPVMRLDDYRHQHALAAPDLLKMDVQGSELKILSGGDATCREAKVLMLETWLYPGYGPETPLLGDITAWLAERHFGLVEFGDTYVAPNLLITSIDAFFVRADITSKLAEAGVNLRNA
jgi:FkbM family methyltransferase